MSEPKKLVVMISSTTKDLAEHRSMVLEACRRVGLDVSRMEELPALDKDAAAISVAMVRQADVYIGVFAHRYGYVPDGSDISVIEKEYKEAVANKIPRLCFLIDEDLPVSPKMMDIGLAGEKLKAFKDRVSKDRVVGFFTTAKELRGLVIHALETFKADQVNPDAPKPIPSLHFVHPIPKPPEPYIAHYYALLQTDKIIGRRAELDRLTQWITKSPFPMMHVVAIGGMGKSALTWHWFHHIAPQEWPRMKGRIWWSFYESDGHFENFVTRSLAYVSGQSEAEVRKQNLRDRCDGLIQILHKEPYLIVLDGLERILTAYARIGLYDERFGPVQNRLPKRLPNQRTKSVSTFANVCQAKKSDSHERKPGRVDPSPDEPAASAKCAEEQTTRNWVPQAPARNHKNGHQ